MSFDRNDSTPLPGPSPGHLIIRPHRSNGTDELLGLEERVIEKRVASEKIKVEYDEALESLGIQSTDEGRDKLLTFTLRYAQSKEELIKAEIQVEKKKRQRQISTGEEYESARKNLLLQRMDVETFQTVMNATCPDLKDSMHGNLKEDFQKFLCQWVAWPIKMKQVKGGHKRAKTWKSNAVEFYDALPSDGDPDMVWCHATHQFVSRYNVTAAHIIPHALDSEIVSTFFGCTGAEDIISSPSNCLLLDTVLEKAFDRGDFIIVPAKTSSGEPPEFEIRLISRNLINRRATSHHKWSDFDGRRLQFLGKSRPSRRALYMRFLSTLLAYKQQDLEFREFAMSQATGKIWATPGKWINRSFIRQVAQHVGDLSLEDEIEDGVFDDEESSLEKARHIALRFSESIHRSRIGKRRESIDDSEDECSDEDDE